MRRLFISLLLTVCTLSLFAQGPGKGPKFDPQKFEQNLEAKVLQRMNLTQAEKTKFLPLYREMRKKELAVMKAEGDLSKKGQPKNNAEWAERLKKHDATQVSLKKIQQVYHEKMLKVVSAWKVMAMIKAEEDYHRDAFAKFQGFKPGPGGGHKPLGPGPGGKK